MTYHFTDSLHQGEQDEEVLDAYFEHLFQVVAATPAQQRQGIDRVFSREGQRILVEYKADQTATRTGNAFVETVSVDTVEDYRLGWAYTSQAEWLIYYLPLSGRAYWIILSDLRIYLPRWERIYPTRAIPNEGYHTLGLLVPLSEFEMLCDGTTGQGRVITLPIRAAT